ncbi:MAG TPA: cysteine methyltransferase [Gammaproteobacteria bacterium]|nr:cysteine methyltransferase [Gammaproteobacteria bacterium]
MNLMSDIVNTEVGSLSLVCSEKHLIAVEFEDMESRLSAHLKARCGEYRLCSSKNPLGVSSQLEAYFAGDLSAIDTVSVDPFGTDFQHMVWRALREIPVGETVSYGQLAARLGKPTASRAVGLANSKNPIGIVIPCHRVVGANGDLTGYAGGLERKRWLLGHEQVSGQLSLPC